MGDRMTYSGGTAGLREPITLIERQAFLKLPLEERRKIMAKQAREIAVEYGQERGDDLETGEILEY
jgi:hypothetical protein